MPELKSSDPICGLPGVLVQFASFQINELIPKDLTMAAPTQKAGSNAAEAAEATNDTGSQTPRKIPGNLPYLGASGTLKKVLDGVIEAERPTKVNGDFLENVLKLKGGSARATVPILKKAGLLAVDGSPTELYARFKTGSGRGQASVQALKAGFPEIFKRSEYAHTVPDTKLRDIIIEITGLKANDPIVGYIRNTFDVFKGYVGAGAGKADEEVRKPLVESEIEEQLEKPKKETGISLAYNINVVLPETSDMKVLNAIFRSIKENLLQ